MRSASARQVILAQRSRHRRLGGVLSADLVSLPSRRASVSACVSFPHVPPAPGDTKHRSRSLRGDRTSCRNRRQKAPPSPPRVHGWRVTRGTQFRGAERSTCCLLLSCVQLPATPWTVAHRAPLCMGVSRQEYWSALLQGIFPTPGSNRGSYVSCTGGGSFPLAPPGTQFRLSQFCW